MGLVKSSANLVLGFFMVPANANTRPGRVHHTDDEYQALRRMLTADLNDLSPEPLISRRRA